STCPRPGRLRLGGTRTPGSWGPPVRPAAVAGGLAPVLGCQGAQRDRVERGDARLQAEAVGEERDGLFDLAACQHVIADDEAFGGLACIRASDLACPTLDRRHRSSTQPWGSAS